MVADKCRSCSDTATATCTLNHARVTQCGEYSCVSLTEKLRANMELMNAHPHLTSPDEASPLCQQTDEKNNPCRFVTDEYYPFQAGHDRYVQHESDVPICSYGLHVLSWMFCEGRPRHLERRWMKASDGRTPSKI